MNTATDARNIILLYESEVIFNRFRQAFGDRYRIHWGKDLNTTMEILAQCDVGVIICDVHFHQQDIYPVVLALKHLHPDLVTMIVAQSQSKEEIAELEAQEEIFAALVRPITQMQVNETLDAAFNYYLSRRKAEAEQIRAAQQKADAAAAANSPFAGMSLIEALAAKAEMAESTSEQSTSSHSEFAFAEEQLPEDILALDDLSSTENAEAEMGDASKQTEEKEDKTTSFNPSRRNQIDENSVDFMFFEDMEIDD